MGYRIDYKKTKKSVDITVARHLVFHNQLFNEVMPRLWHTSPNEQYSALSIQSGSLMAIRLNKDKNKKIKTG